MKIREKIQEKIEMVIIAFLAAVFWKSFNK